MAQTGTSNRSMICWVVGLIGGVIAFLILKGALGMIWAFVLAVVVGLCLCFILSKSFSAAGDEAAAVPPTANKAAPMAQPAPAPTPETPVAEPEAPAVEPEVHVPAAPDDLKKLKGVGPKIEEKLHAAGITTFAQIAAWGPEEIAKMDDLLSFKGRIERDGWVEQAKTLSVGGLTEFAKRVEDGDVY